MKGIFTLCNILIVLLVIPDDCESPRASKSKGKQRMNPYNANKNAIGSTPGTSSRHMTLGTSAGPSSQGEYTAYDFNVNSQYYNTQSQAGTSDQTSLHHDAGESQLPTMQPGGHTANNAVAGPSMKSTHPHPHHHHQQESLPVTNKHQKAPQHMHQPLFTTIPLDVALGGIHETTAKTMAPQNAPADHHHAHITNQPLNDDRHQHRQQRHQPQPTQHLSNKNNHQTLHTSQTLDAADRIHPQNAATHHNNQRKSTTTTQQLEGDNRVTQQPPTTHKHPSINSQHTKRTTHAATEGQQTIQANQQASNPIPPNNKQYYKISYTALNERYNRGSRKQIQPQLQLTKAESVKNDQNNLAVEAVNHAVRYAAMWIPFFYNNLLLLNVPTVQGLYDFEHMVEMIYSGTVLLTFGNPNKQICCSSLTKRIPHTDVSTPHLCAYPVCVQVNSFLRKKEGASMKTCRAPMLREYVPDDPNIQFIPCSDNKQTYSHRQENAIAGPSSTGSTHQHQHAQAPVTFPDAYNPPGIDMGYDASFYTNQPWHAASSIQEAPLPIYNSNTANDHHNQQQPTSQANAIAGPSSTVSTHQHQHAHAPATSPDAYNLPGIDMGYDVSSYTNQPWQTASGNQETPFLTYDTNAAYDHHLQQPQPKSEIIEPLQYSTGYPLVAGFPQPTTNINSQNVPASQLYTHNTNQPLYAAQNRQLHYQEQPTINQLVDNENENSQVPQIAHQTQSVNPPAQQHTKGAMHAVHHTTPTNQKDNTPRIPNNAQYYSSSYIVVEKYNGGSRKNIQPQLQLTAAGVEPEYDSVAQAAVQHAVSYASTWVPYFYNRLPPENTPQVQGIYDSQNIRNNIYAATVLLMYSGNEELCCSALTRLPTYAENGESHLCAYPVCTRAVRQVRQKEKSTLKTCKAPSLTKHILAHPDSIAFAPCNAN